MSVRRPVQVRCTASAHDLLFRRRFSTLCSREKYACEPVALCRDVSNSIARWSAQAARVCAAPAGRQGSYQPASSGGDKLGRAGESSIGDEASFSASMMISRRSFGSPILKKLRSSRSASRSGTPIDLPSSADPPAGSADADTHTHSVEPAPERQAFRWRSEDVPYSYGLLRQTRCCHIRGNEPRRAERCA